MKNAMWLVYAVALLIGISYGMHNPVLPLFAKNEIGATYSELGLIGLANFVPYMFIPLFVGMLLDRFNNGYLLTLGVIINSSAIFLLSTANSVAEIMIFRVFTGIAHAFFWPPSESIISRTSAKGERVKNISRFTGFFIGGFMIGPLFGSILLENFDESFRLLFQVTAFVLASAIIASLLTARHKITLHKKMISILNIKEIARFKTVIAIILFCNMVFGTILIIYPAYLNDNSFNPVEVEILYFFFGISRVVTLVFAGWLSQKTSTTLVFACLSITLGMILSVTADDFVVYSFALLSMGFGFGIFFPLTLEIVLSKTKESIRGSMIGVFETIFGIGWVIGPLTAGIISEQYGNEFPYLVFFVVGVGISILAIVRKKILEPQTKVL